MLRSSLLTGVRAYSIEFVRFRKRTPKFLKGALKLTENFQEVTLKGFLIRNLQTCKMLLSAVSVVKTPEITSTVKFLSSEAGANRFSTE